MTKKYEQITNAILKSLILLAILLLWEIGPRLGWADPRFLPPFSEVLMTIHHLAMDGSLFIHLIVSLWRVVLGLALAVLIGLPLGLVLGGWLTGLEKTLRPLIRILGQVNPISLMPVFMVFFGIGEPVKIVIVAWVCVWPILFHTITGIRTVDPLLIKSALSMGLSRFGLIYKVLLPGALPTVFVGLRIGTSLAFFLLIAAEMLGASSGLGWLVHYSGVSGLYAGGTLIILLGVAVNKLLLRLEKGLFVWKEPALFFSLNSDVNSFKGSENSKAKSFKDSDTVSSNEPVHRKTGPWGKQKLAIVAIILISIILAGSQLIRSFETQQAQKNEHTGHQNHKRE